MPRLFTAIEIPEAIAREAARLQHPAIAEARWIKPPSFHITLRYIGNVDDSAAAEIDAALAVIAARPVSVQLSGVGYFGGAHPRALWIGIAPHASLEALYRQIDQRLTALGLPSERKRYTPHLTLARMRRTIMLPVLQNWLSAHSQFHAAPFIAERFALFSSRYNKSRANPYIAERLYPLLTR